MSKAKRRKLRLGSWLPWLALHAYMTYLTRNGPDPLFETAAQIFYFVLSWGIGLVVLIMYWLFRNKDTTSYKITLWILFLGPCLTTIYADNRHFETRTLQRIAAEEVNRLCLESGGSKIYRVADGVEGILQMVPMPSDYKHRGSQYGRMYSWHRFTGDTNNPQPLIRPSKNSYIFLERVNSTEGSTKKYTRHFATHAGKILRNLDPNQPFPRYSALKFHAVETNKPQSKYGWKAIDITTTAMRDQWISAGKVKVIELATEEVLAEMTGFYAAAGDGPDPWRGSIAHRSFCPKQNITLHKFLREVLIPAKDYPREERLTSLME